MTSLETMNVKYVQYEQGYTVQVSHIISTNEDFWYK